MCLRVGRDMNRMDNAKSGRVTDALLNYETVKYFNNERLETANLADAIVDYQAVEYKLLASLAGLNVIQSAVIFSGLVAGLLVCTKVRAARVQECALPDVSRHLVQLHRICLGSRV